MDGYLIKFILYNNSYYEFIKTFIDGVIRIEPIRFQDERGFFSETYNLKAFKGFGIDTIFIQDNYSLSKKVGTVRGPHFQKEPFGQAKLVKCSKGKIFNKTIGKITIRYIFSCKIETIKIKLKLILY